MSIRNVPIGKTGLPFQNFRLSREFSSGTKQKIVYHLHPNRNFREFVVNGKQPICLTFARYQAFFPSVANKHYYTTAANRNGWSIWAFGYCLLHVVPGVILLNAVKNLDLLQVDLLASGASLVNVWPRSGWPRATRSCLVPRHVKSDEGLFWKSMKAT